jgi:hypothetical protein
VPVPQPGRLRPSSQPRTAATFTLSLFYMLYRIWLKERGMKFCVCKEFFLFTGSKEIKILVSRLYFIASLKERFSFALMPKKMRFA